MPATVVTFQPDSITETVDFLRRLSSMMAGSRNAEMLSQAAVMIETLTLRAETAEELFRQQQDETENILALRDVAEMASDNLMTEVYTLKTQLADGAWRAETERTRFAEKARRLQELADEAAARLAAVNAEFAAMRAAFGGFDENAVVVPMDTLRLARAQFDNLACSFAKGGDIVSQTICEIGACAIEQAIARGQPAKSR